MPPSPLFAPNYNQYASNASGLDIAEFCIWNGPDGETVADHVYSQRVIDEDVFRGRVELDALVFSLSNHVSHFLPSHNLSTQAP